MRRTKTVAVTGAAVLSAALCAGGAVAAETGASASATPRCDTSDLSVSLSDGGQAGSQSGMSHAGQFLRFRNTGSGTCALYGYPGLGLEDAAHKPLKTTAAWGNTYFTPNSGKHTVTLKSGQSAWADLAWTQTGADDAAKSQYLEVTPPGATTHRTLAFERVVDGGTLQVTALSSTVPHIG
ncbi:DUF4232 domain-containing protein [Streptomyces sp. NPDC088725]|uniref:DUF4232 domain-containing protein n=1 Tax=Streptomyces sp. NPDC088725 TaxID=3365873 RepID=UPI0037F68BB5